MAGIRVFFLPMILFGMTSAQCPTPCSLTKIFATGEICDISGNPEDVGGKWELQSPIPNPRCNRVINGVLVNVCLYKRIENPDDGKELCFCDPGDCKYTEVVWSPMQTKVWGDLQCPLLGSYQAETLEGCKQKCQGTTGCTAINYNSGTYECETRGCPPIVPVPLSEWPGWNGYYIILP